MPPKAQNNQVPQDELTKLTVSLPPILQYLDTNRSTLTSNTPINLPDNISVNSSAAGNALLKLSTFTYKFSTSLWKAAQIDIALSTIVKALELNYIQYLPTVLRDYLLDFTQSLILSNDFAIKALSKYNLLYICGDILNSPISFPFRGSYWQFATCCYRFAVQRGVIPHTGYPTNVTILDPTIHSTPQQYHSLWSALSTAALRDIAQYFQQPTAASALHTGQIEEAQTVSKPLEWRHIVYTIDLIVQVSSNSRLLCMFAPEGPDFLASPIISSTLITISKTIGLVIAVCQELLNNLNGNTSCVDPITKKAAPLTTEQKMQFKQLPSILSELYQVVIGILSPNELTFEDELDQLTRQMKKMEVSTKTTTTTAIPQISNPGASVKLIKPTASQRLWYNNFLKRHLFANFAPVLINDMILLINNPILQSDIFFLLLLVVEMSHEHMIYFSLGHTTSTPILSPISSYQATPTALAIIIQILSNRFSPTTVPEPFSPKLKTTMSVGTAQWLLSNEELVQFCCCMLDLIVTVLQQSTSLQTNTETTSTDYSIIIRQLMIHNGIFTLVTNFSNQIFGELTHIRAKQTHFNAMKKGKKGQTGTALNEVELQYIPSYILTNRLFYIFASLFNFSHRTIIHAYTQQQQNNSEILSFLTLFTTSTASSFAANYQTTLTSLFNLFSPCDIRDQEIFDNNETCDSLYCFLVHIQLYLYLAKFQQEFHVQNTAQISDFITSSVTCIQNTIQTVSADLDAYADKNPIKLDKKAQDHLSLLLKRNVTILSMVDHQVTHVRQDYTICDVYTVCNQVLSHLTDQNDKNTLLQHYIETYSDINTPPSSTLLPRAQPFEAFLSNLVNKTLHVDAVLQQNKEQLFDIGFDDDFDENGKPKPDFNDENDKKQQHKAEMDQIQEEEEDSDDDDDDEDNEGSAFCFGGDGFSG